MQPIKNNMVDRHHFYKKNVKNALFLACFK